MATIVAAAANDDTVVQPGASFRENSVYPELRKSATLLPLHGPDHQRRHVTRAMGQPDARLFTGLGHGTASEFKGQHGLPVYSAKQVQAGPGIRGRIFHLCSCSTAQVLGPALLQAGASAFFGYLRPVLVNYIDPPGLFYGADAEIDRALAEGSTCSEALMRAEEAFQEAIQQAEKTGNGSVGVLITAAQDLVGPSVDEPRWGDLQTRL
jgi:hypothetical protein